MTTYIFVGPNAPHDNVKIKAASAEKAIKKFLSNRLGQAFRFSPQQGKFHKEVFIFYSNQAR